MGLRRWLHRNRLSRAYLGGNIWIEWYWKGGERKVTRVYNGEPPYNDPPAPKEAKWR